MTADPATRRGRPRSTQADARILDAARGLLLARGYDGLSVEEVARQAGVAKTTLYRRWPTKDHLAVAVAAQILGEVPIPTTGDLPHDLTSFLAALGESLNRLRTAGQPDGVDDRSAGLVAELVAAAARHSDIGAGVRAGYAQRHTMALARLRGARDHEGLRDDVDLALLVEQLVGPIYYRVLVTGEPVDRGYAQRLVTAVLDDALAPPTRRDRP
ncbi:MAG TPA: TetR/AcrR family transcriptional regulator [Actinomycetes bacterium]|jgi:AcrR family transcriptional regulator|nr:TetR/AcrR family transcriptional regulator [Actinomycetes bacterium]